MNLEKRKAEIMYGRGESYAAIARELGVSWVTARKMLDPKYKAACQGRVKKYLQTPRGNLLNRLLSTSRNARVNGYEPCLTDAEEILKADCGKCAICDRENQRLQVDHCHKTGKFRGWLCGRCNRLLGMVGDDAGVLTKAVQFLSSERVRDEIYVRD